MLLTTPLHAIHQQAKARLVPFAGWEMPVQYAGVLAEARAVRTSAGIFDVSHMGRLRVHGADAFAFLQYVFVNDLSRLSESGGEAQYSLLCRDAGGIIDDIIIYRLGLSDFVVVVNASNADKDVAWLQHHVARFPHVTMEVETQQTALLAVQGPNAVALLDTLADADLQAVPRFGLCETSVANISVMAARTGYTGEDGYELFCAAADAPALWSALMDAGVVPCGLGARDTLRIEAALPLYGHEMDEHVNPYMARLGWVVRPEKDAEYVGKSVLRDLHESDPAEVLVGLTLRGRGVPRDGYVVESLDGTVVGHVTSGTHSVMLEKGIALARVQRAYRKRGTSLNVVIRETRHEAEVTPLPFFKRV